MNLAVSFSGRKDGNCDRIAKYISGEGDLVLFMREISTQPCADCGYECMSGRCRYRDDGIYSFFDKISAADRIFYIVPMYCGNPSALYFILNERCQDYFMHHESQYEKILEKLYIIGVYGSSEDSPDFLDSFARQYGFGGIRQFQQPDQTVRGSDGKIFRVSGGRRVPKYIHRSGGHSELCSGLRQCGR